MNVLASAVAVRGHFVQVSPEHESRRFGRAPSVWVTALFWRQTEFRREVLRPNPEGVREAYQAVAAGAGECFHRG